MKMHNIINKTKYKKITSTFNMNIARPMINKKNMLTEIAHLLKHIEDALWIRLDVNNNNTLSS